MYVEVVCGTYKNHTEILEKQSFRISSMKKCLYGLFMMIPTFHQSFKHEPQVKILASKGEGGKELLK